MQPRRPEPPKKPQTQIHKKPAPAPHAPAKDSKKMLIIGGAAGGVLLLIILIVVLSGDDDGRPETKKKADKKEEKKEVPAEALRIESEARRKCEEGRKVAAKFAELRNPGAFGKETVYNAIEGGIRTFRDGIADYKRAAEMAGRKNAALAGFESELNDIVGKFVMELETEGKLLCDAGKSAVDSKLPQVAGASGEKKDALFLEVEKGLEKLTNGLALYDRAGGVSGKQADTSGYRAAREKGLKELLPALEREGEAACKEGLSLFEKIQDKMGKTLDGAEKDQYVRDVVKVYTLLKHGLNLYQRANAISGRQYDLNQYNQAFKLAKNEKLANE